MSEETILRDSRFAKVLNDPKFKKVPKHDRKVRIDKRFQSMFTDDAFRVKYTVDKRGKQISKSTTEDFKKFYELSDDEGNDISSDEAEDSEDSDQVMNLGAEKTSDDTDNESENDPSVDESTVEVKKKKKPADKLPSLTQEEEDLIKKKQISRNVRKKLKDMTVDYARGEGKLFSESSSDESESEESEEEIHHDWNELDKDADTTENITNRLAVCNMDWDRVRAVDLMMLFNSFLPSQGLIHSVVIYPSEFGLKRMAEEEEKGPTELVNTETVESDSDSETEEGKQFHVERMRQYQLKRLKYYYAVATFDSAETANVIYNNCNGVEYETSGVRLDLRFIDENITFDQKPKDVCDNTEACQKYQPLFFKNTALLQAKVELTWDETDPRRAEVAHRITEAARKQDINDSDLENLVALSSSDDEEEKSEEETFEAMMSDDSTKNNSDVPSDDDPISTYKNLLKEIEDNEKADENSESEGELEITWGADTKSSRQTTRISKQSASKDNEDKLTPFELILEKRKQKSKIRKASRLQKKNDENNSDNEKEDGTKSLSKKKSKYPVITEADEKQRNELELLLLDENDDNKHHFSLKKLEEKEKKNKRRKFKKDTKKPVDEDDFEVDVADDRFSALYSSHLFNIDPTDPKFHKTKGMNAFVLEKQKRLSQNKNNESIQDQDEPELKKKKDSELAFLVKSIKNKTKSMLPGKFNKRS